MSPLGDIPGPARLGRCPLPNYERLVRHTCICFSPSQPESAWFVLPRHWPPKHRDELSRQDVSCLSQTTIGRDLPCRLEVSQMNKVLKLVIEGVGLSFPEKRLALWSCFTALCFVSRVLPAWRVLSVGNLPVRPPLARGERLFTLHRLCSVYLSFFCRRPCSLTFRGLCEVSVVA